MDIGGSNIRVGIVKLNAKRAPDLSRAKVAAFEIWRHAEDKPKREEAVDQLIEMLERSIAKAAQARIKLAPLIAIGCPARSRAMGLSTPVRRICRATGRARA